MASTSLSGTSKSDDRQHYPDTEAAQKKQSGESSLSSSSKQMKYIPFVVLGTIMVMSATMGSIWAAVKPKRPVYAIEYVHITETDPLLDNTYLTGNFNFVMRSYNPNKKSNIYYKSMEIYNSYSENETPTSVKHVEDLSQPPFNVTRISFIVPLHISTGPRGNVVEYLQHGRVTLNISAEAKMRFEYRWWRFMPRTIKIYCQPAAVLLGDNSQPTDCYVNF
ncbi:uncharacterized protein At1g08160 [Ziziphus jujuba]|uniref:Uncharacterized protein At1g08160 n=2 Tax=Ziziphus jujuba TaxID=326968 RepID=A0A6P3Z6X2_ZIZJJ|nr:uncharacterized protein At1g08160 [Ziziphus jujuba]KAH7542094.1 hypothetical protein FEM48_Zijuj02G0036800 [Ziziphus jujuba var. spinosa]